MRLAGELQNGGTWRWKAYSLKLIEIGQHRQ